MAALTLLTAGLTVAGVLAARRVQALSFAALPGPGGKDFELRLRRHRRIATGLRVAIAAATLAALAVALIP